MMSFIGDIAGFRARRTPDREAVYDWDSGKRYTWQEIASRADRMACFFVDVLGVGKGDRVGFLSSNCLAMLDAFFATYRTGVILDTYNHRLLTRELVALADVERPSALFYTACCQDKALAIKNHLGGACALVCIDDPHDLDADFTFEDVEAVVPRALEPAPLRLDDPQMLIHTGGTTGMPKAAVLSYRSMLMNALAGILSLEYTADDVTYAGMPFCHTAGWNVTMLPVLLAGGRIVMTCDFSAEAFLDIVESEGVTTFFAADAMYRSIADHSRFPDADLSSLKWVMGGGGPVSLASMEAFWNKGVKFLTGYGMTETGPNNVAPAVTASLEENRAKPFTVGKPLAFTEVRVVDAAGNNASPGERGEILMRGELSFSGYWAHDEETRTAFDNGWVRTGDMGVLDDEGDLTLCGRTKNMYISGGENVFPVEVERCLEACPGIREACVFGIADEKWGEVGKAILVKEPGADLGLSDIEQYLKRSLSTIKRPRFVEFVQAIPKNATGKRDEKAIERLYGRP